MTDEVFVVPLDFKSTKSRELITVNEDGSYTIFINSRLSYDAQLKAYEHALKHIQNGDFDKNDVQQIETTAHDLPKEKEQERFSSSEFEAILQAIRKRRAKIKRQLKAYEKKIEFMLEHDPDGFNRRAEYQYLYGNDL